MKTAFVICTEKGNLELYSLLLCESIRKFGGKLSTANIYSFQPRKGTEVSNKTLSKFKELRVTHITEHLNVDFEDYPFSNKIFACKYVEDNFKEEEVIIFLDSDKIIVNPPSEIYEFNQIIGVRPVEKKGIGFSSISDDNYNYWQSLEEKFDFKFTNFIQTTVTREDVNPYWNAGFIVGKTNNNVWNLWHETFLSLMSNSLIPKQGKTFMDQVALSIIIEKHFKNETILLNENYNVPCFSKNLIPNISSNSVSIHYHKLFANSYEEDIFSLSELEKEKKIWINSKLKEYSIYPRNFSSKAKYWLSKCIKLKNG